VTDAARGADAVGRGDGAGGSPLVAVESRTGMIQNKEQFSDLAMYVYHKASFTGCKAEDIQDKNLPTVPWWNREKGGYPGLEDTWLTSTPDRYGASDTAINDVGDIQGQSGLDMEGIFSRQEFEIAEDTQFVIKNERDYSRDGEGDYKWWIEDGTIDEHSIAASTQGYEERVPGKSECGSTGQIPTTDSFYTL
jgi:hypothetical protein